jgi:hypothetical protein
MFFNFATFTCKVRGVDLGNSDSADCSKWNDICLPLVQRPEIQKELCRGAAASWACATAENKRCRTHSGLRIETCHSVAQGEGHSAAPKRCMVLSRSNGRKFTFVSFFVVIILVSVLIGCAGLQQSKQLSSASTTNSTSTASPSSTSSAPPAKAHSVQLTWAPHHSREILGYNVYRATQSGGPYARLNPALLANPDYLDTTVAGGQRYYYAVTATTAMVESHRSAEVVASIPR